MLGLKHNVNILVDYDPKWPVEFALERERISAALGGAILDRIYALDWAKRDRKTRTLIFSPRGEKQFLNTFRIS